MTNRQFFLTVLLLHACAAGLLIASDEPIGQSHDFGIEAAERVLVATRDLAKGTVVKEPQKYFVMHGVSAGATPENAIKDGEDLKYRKLKKAVPKGKIITKTDLYTGKEFLLDHVPAGSIAIPFFTTPDCMVGFIAPGSRGSLILSRDESGNRVASFLSFQRIVLIDGCGPWYHFRGKTRQVAIVAAPPPQALMLLIAQFVGDLRISLERYGSEEEPS